LTREGARHLAFLAREPRPAGGAAEQEAREYAAARLRDAGFRVDTEPFAYSAFPGRYATPIGGALAMATVAASAWLGAVAGLPGAALGALAAGVALLGLFVRRMLGDAVLSLPWLREASANLVATRGDAEPAVWLVAHLDSKSQPVPSAARVAGVALLVAALLLALVACLVQLAGADGRTVWWAAALAALLGGPPVLASVVGARSNGAVDNASGVAAVLAAAALLPPGTPLGVLLPSAEELGLAGARAWARGRRPAIALNCDGVDDEGELTIMFTGSEPRALVDTLRSRASRGPRVRRMPLGLLTDSVALADAGWDTVTVSRGSLGTLRRIHTPADSLANLRGDGIDEVATLLAGAVEALT
jgi:hypothetical protein